MNFDMLLTFINRLSRWYFNSDPEVAGQLGELENQRILLSLIDLKKKFLITVENTSVIIAEYPHDEEAQEIAATVHIGMATLLRLALGEDYMPMLKSGILKIEGNIETIDRLRAIFTQVEVDWEEIVSEYLGDSLAYQSGVFARRAKNYLRRSGENFRLDVSEYLQEESRTVPTRTETDRFLHDVDALDADIERLEARVSRLGQGS